MAKTHNKKINCLHCDEIMSSIGFMSHCHSLTAHSQKEINKNNAHNFFKEKLDYFNEI